MRSNGGMRENVKRRAAFWAYLLCILCFVICLSNFALYEIITGKETKPLLRNGSAFLRKHISSGSNLPASDEQVASFQATTPKYTAAEMAAMNCSYMPWYKYTGKALWVPGYPGSGSDMLRSLITAITGLGGHGVYSGEECFHNHTATCKTHWPKFHNIYPPDEYTDVASKRVVMLIRNPKDAMPSYFNYLWEIRHSLMDHTIQAPEEEWNSWRDEESPTEFSNYWKGLIRSWKELDDYEIAFYLPYERLTDIETGPLLLSKLAAELRANGVRVAAEKDIPCLWYKVIKGRSKTKRAPHKYVPSYTSHQKARLIRSLEKLEQEFADDSELGDILSMYRDDSRNNIRVSDQ